MKKCSKCGIEKPLTPEYYHRASRNTSGFQSHCKVCRAEHQQNNKEKISKYYAEYRQKNKERLRKQKTVYDQNNKEKIAKREVKYYQDMKNKQPGCIYQIVNSVNNKIYIGETTRGELRWKQHLQYLRGNRHKNHKLQADFDKFGEEVFTWSIIKEYPKDKDTLLLEEIKTIDKLLKEGKELYNLSLTIDQLKLLMENK